MASAPAISKQKKKASIKITNDAWSLVKALANLDQAIPPSTWRALWQSHVETDPYLFTTIMKCNRLAADALPLPPPTYPNDCTTDSGRVNMLSSDDLEEDEKEIPRSSRRRARRLRRRSKHDPSLPCPDETFSSTYKGPSSYEDSEQEESTDVLSDVDGDSPCTRDGQSPVHKPSGYVMCNHRYERLKVGGIYSVPLSSENLSYFEVISPSEIRWFYTPEECADAAQEKSFSNLNVPKGVNEENCVALETLFYDHNLHIDIDDDHDEPRRLLNVMETTAVQILFDSSHTQELARLWPTNNMGDDIGVCSVNAQSIVTGAPPHVADPKLIYVVGEFRCESLMIGLYTKSPYDFAPIVDLETDQTNLINMLLSNMKGKLQFPDLKNSLIKTIPKDDVNQGTCQLCMTHKPLSFSVAMAERSVCVGSLCEQRLALAKRVQQATTTSDLENVRVDIHAFLRKHG